MSTIKKVSDNIIEVKEDIHGFHKTKTSYWYYDILNWKSSSTGKKDSPVDRVMTQSSIDWCKKYYIPKVS